MPSSGLLLRKVFFYPFAMLNNRKDPSTYSYASGENYHYVVLQVTLKEKLIGTGSTNLSALESVINEQAEKGYRLHTMTTSTVASTGLGGGERIQATLVFESLGCK